MVLMLCLDFSKSYNDLSFQKVHLFNRKIIKTAESGLWVWADGWFSLHYILDSEACELHFCTMRLYIKHHFIYHKDHLFPYQSISNFNMLKHV